MDRLMDRGHMYTNITCIMTSAWPCRQCSLMERRGLDINSLTCSLMCAFAWSSAQEPSISSILCFDMTSSTSASAWLSIWLAQAVFLLFSSVSLVLFQYQTLIGAECANCVWTWTINDDCITKWTLVQHVKYIQWWLMVDHIIVMMRCLLRLACDLMNPHTWNFTPVVYSMACSNGQWVWPDTCVQWVWPDTCPHDVTMILNCMMWYTLTAWLAGPNVYICEALHLNNAIILWDSGIPNLILILTIIGFTHSVKSHEAWHIAYITPI